VAWIITVHGVIYSKYMSQKYLTKCELVAQIVRIQKLYCTSTNKNLKTIMQLK
jgi:hypothetical protein